MLATWNPWWSANAVPSALTGRPRALLPRLLRDLERPEAVVLTGVRRSGKTTLLHQAVAALLERGVEPERILYVNLEDVALDGVDLEDIARAYRQAKAPGTPRYILLDEVQTRAGWERWVRTQVDHRDGTHLAVTGSTSGLLGGAHARLLTGRNLVTHVRPLSFREFLAFHGVEIPAPPVAPAAADVMVHHLDRYLDLGGFPEPNRADPAEARRLLQHYFTDILHRDVATRGAHDVTRVRALAAYLAETAARPHTKRSLQRATGLARDTVRDLLDALEGAYLLQRAARFTWSPKPEAEAQAPFKAYLVDVGLRNAVASPHALDRGRLAENAVANALATEDVPLRYWSGGGGEVDFVVPRPGGRVDAFQVTYGDDVPPREVEGLRALADALPKSRRGLMVLLTRDREDDVQGFRAVRLWRWLVERDVV